MHCHAILLLFMFVSDENHKTAFPKEPGSTPIQQNLARQDSGCP
jgi:hypothetical protein